MNIQNYKIGIDIDNTLTDTPEVHFSKIPLEEVREIIRNAPVKKGVEILSITDTYNILITGRGSYFHKDSEHWLHKNQIPYMKLHTIDSPYKFSLQEYLKYKVNIYLTNHVHFCLEDDIRVINELEKYGIKCSLVEDDFERAFWELFK